MNFNFVYFVAVSQSYCYGSVLPDCASLDFFTVRAALLISLNIFYQSQSKTVQYPDLCYKG